MSRGAMAAFLGRALNLTDDDGRDWFIDDNGHLFENDINRLAAAGITRGCNPPANDKYCPDGSVTRGAMAAFLVRAFGYSDGAGADLFDDDDGSTFENDIDRLGTAGVTKGCNPPTNTKYCPGDDVKRDQMATFLARALGLKPITPSTTTTTSTTTTSTTTTSTTTTTTKPNCDPAYPDFCIPPPPPDLNCSDIPQKNFTVLPPDPHGFDGDKNGFGCET